MRGISGRLSDSGVLVTHRYTRSGTFTIVLSVTSDTRATSTSIAHAQRVGHAVGGERELHLLADTAVESTSR